MSKSTNTVKHTPGPWIWQVHDHSCASLGAGDSPGYGTPLVMSVSPCRSCADRATKGEWQWGRCMTPCEADATLIAAAPDLLEALKLVADSGKFACFDDAAWDVVNAAISKATGSPAPQEKMEG